MAGNLGFSQNQNLLEVTDGAEALQNLGGGTIDADLRLFAGSSTRKSKLFWNRYKNNSTITESPTDITPGTRLNFSTVSLYSDEDIVTVSPVSLIRDIAFYYVGFDADGVLTEINGLDINYIRGEDYTPGTYNNLPINGGNGDGATANIIVNDDGEVSSVEIVDNGTGYNQGDVLSVVGIGPGRGFIIRIVGFPWRAIIVGNSAFDACLLSNATLSVEIQNTNSALNGTYSLRKNLTTGLNSFYEPNKSNLQAYDVNRLQFAQQKIDDNVDLYDIDGDEQFTQIDVDLIEIYLNNQFETEPVQLAAFQTYIDANTAHFNQATVRRNNSVRIRNYFTGLSPELYDVDGTELRDTTINIDILSEYVNNSNTVYGLKSASSLIAVQPVSPINFTHTNIIEVPIRNNPNYSIDPEEQSSLPYIRIFKSVFDNPENIFDNFQLYGTRQTCTTNLNDFVNNVQVGSTNTTFNYKIFRKFAVGGQYFVDIVITGTGLPLNQPFGTAPELTPVNATPVFDSADEYGIFDSNVINFLFLKTNPRSSLENIKRLVLFSELYQSISPAGLLASTTPSPYENLYVSVPTLLPDLILERDDSLTTDNIANLNPPEIVDDGNLPGQPITDSGFSYGSVTNNDGSPVGFSSTLGDITNTVDEALYLRTTKYRIDTSLYYQREIKINGLISSYDPDAFNVNTPALTDPISPGIYISDSTSQITNPLASDFARKTRSFSSNYNPWRDDFVADALSTGSLNVTINDLVWTTEIKLDIGRDVASPAELANMGYETGIVGETLDTNFNQTTVDNDQSYKLKTIINGEVFYIIMRKS
jgi:hypothetical protein